ncbi:MAG: MFS transporter [Sphingomonadaceae bacterium]
MTEPELSKPPSPFQIPIFRAMWIASLVSNFGGLIQSVGASWLMTSLTPSQTLVALVQTSVTLPIMLLSLLSGAIADNAEQRSVMLCAQGFMLVVSAVLAIFAWNDMLTPWLLLGFTFLLGIGTALNNPSWQASVGEMVPRSVLPAAVSFNSMGFNLARSVGPAIGGAIVAAAGAATAFLINAVSYVGLIAVLARWKPPTPPRQLPRENIGAAVEAGIRYVSMSPHLRVVILRASIFGFTASAVSALMPLIARDHVSGGALTYGLLLGAFGVGAVLGALNSRRVRERRSNEQVATLGILMMAVGTIAAGVSYILPITIAALMLSGGGWIITLATLNITVQMSSPRWVVGRALSIYQMAAFGGMAIGSWGAGLLADWDGVGTALVIAGVLQVAAALLGLRYPLPQVEQLNLDPLSRWQEPDTAVAIQPRSGPIVTTIEYRVDEANVAAFLVEMGERRRIRIRDGARHWALLRDLTESDLWIERYHVATWVEYVRHNQRRTQTDAANSERLMELHKGPDAPKVHRMIERQTGALGTPVTGQIGDPLTDPTRSS